MAVVVPNPKALQELADSMKISSNWTDLCSNSAVTDEVLKQMKLQAAGESCGSQATLSIEYCSRPNDLAVFLCAKDIVLDITRVLF